MVQDELAELAKLGELIKLNELAELAFELSRTRAYNGGVLRASSPA